MESLRQISEPSLSEVREELRRVLASARFRQSQRLSRLLRYICEKSLIDGAGRITEYTIALDVLGKSENFKEGKDAIVRVEVHRLRKRLAEFYQEEGNSHRLRIVIPSGTYAPQFRFREHESADADRFGVVDGQGAGLQMPPAPESEACALARERRVRTMPLWSRSRRMAVIASIALLLVAGLSAYRAMETGERSLDAFWNPVLSSPNQILLCIGDVAGGHSHPVPEGSGGGPLTLKDFHNAQSQLVHFADATAMARFAGLIGARGKRYRIVSQTEATYAELQSSPVVLIGLLNNDWTKRLVGHLRFTVDRPGSGKVVIRDRANPSRTDWFIDYYKPFLEISRDYAVVLRATDPKTEQMVVAAGGMSILGTLAAAEFLTDRNEIRKLAAVAPTGWERRNLEIVLSTQVIRGNPGPPAIVGSHFW